ncbi:MAG: cell envelope biogenesis protein OmpA, partial [Blautia sp.]|nr:cell envelope biogenesis protein OmpA [Blautia sp.]
MRKKRKSDDGGFSIWRSYSDMMAGVLLLFVLIMCVTLFQAQKSYNDSIKERDEKIALQEEYNAELLEKQMKLDEQAETLAAQKAELEEAEDKSDKQKILLAEMSKQLDEKQKELDALSAQLDEQA